MLAWLGVSSGLRHLIFAATTRKPRFSYPASIARAWPPWVYDTRIRNTWWTELEAFLDGRSPRFLRLLLEELLANDDIPRVRHGLTRAGDLVSHAEMDEFTMKDLGASPETRVQGVDETRAARRTRRNRGETSAGASAEINGEFP